MPFSDQCNTRTVSYDLIQLSYIFQKCQLTVERDKPWFTEDCKILYNSYKRALSIFNDIHSDENRMKLNLEKQKYKRLENKLKACPV
jgi:hypothetical protein